MIWIFLSVVFVVFVHLAETHEWVRTALKVVAVAVGLLTFVVFMNMVGS